MATTMAPSATDNYASLLPGANTTNPVNPNLNTLQTRVTTGGTQTQTGGSTSTQIINRGTPTTQAALETLIATLSKGGSPELQAQLLKKRQTEDFAQQLLASYTSGKAFEEAKGMMALNIQQAQEKNLPIIQQAIEGAGTSGGSMQALLAQNLARDASLAASALGAQQAQVYAGTTANIVGSLMGSTSKVTDPASQALIQALDVSSRMRETVTNTKTGTETTAFAPKTETTTLTPITPAAMVPADTVTSASGVGDGGLDPMRYYSQLGKSGSNQTLYDFLKGM